MKIGFSSLVCPAWDLETVVNSASALSFDGVELSVLQGQSDLRRVPALAEQPERVRELCRESGVEIVCLSAGATLDSCSVAEIERQKAVITSYFELAHAIGCPRVRIDAGRVQSFDNRCAAISRIAGMLASLVPAASRFGVTLLVENTGDFPGSEDLWFLVDTVGHPAVRCCWNQGRAMAAYERPTRSIPRLNTKIGLVHVFDGSFDEYGRVIEYQRLGEGQAAVDRQMELLKGLMHDGYVVFERPRAESEASLDPQTILEPAARFLRGCIDAEQTVLSAYKGDKNAPRMASRVTASRAAR